MRKEIRVVSQRLQINIDDMDKYIDSFYGKAKESNIQLLSVPSVIFLMKSLPLTTAILN